MDRESITSGERYLSPVLQLHIRASSFPFVPTMEIVLFKRLHLIACISNWASLASSDSVKLGKKKNETKKNKNKPQKSRTVKDDTATRRNKRKNNWTGLFVLKFVSLPFIAPKYDMKFIEILLENVLNGQQERSWSSVYFEYHFFFRRKQALFNRCWVGGRFSPIFLSFFFFFFWNEENPVARRNNDAGAANRVSIWKRTSFQSIDRLRCEGKRRTRRPNKKKGNKNWSFHDPGLCRAQLFKLTLYH